MQAPNALLTHLAQPVRCGDAAELARHWDDCDVVLRLAGARRAAPSIGAHLRRSFLGALGPGASAEAQNELPCPWDPPCALDVFRREQMRGPGGDGLPKPYLLTTDTEGPDLIVTLRLFGVAVTWLHAAAEALSAGLRTILPWGKLGHPAPRIVTRDILSSDLPIDLPPRAVRLHLLSPIDISGRDPRIEPWTILSRMIRRVDGVARWSGAALDPDLSRTLSLSCRELEYGVDGLHGSLHHSANSKGQNRRDPVATGVFDVAGDLAPLWPLLRLAERSHIGRHAVEGLGRVALERVD